MHSTGAATPGHGRLPDTDPGPPAKHRPATTTDQAAAADQATTTGHTTNADRPANLVDSRDPLGLATDAPLLRAWLAFGAAAGNGRVTPFTIPGHKQRTDLVGDVVRGDVPLYGGLDTIRQAHGLLRDAESRAAALWGVDWCRFSVGGSTHGNQSLALGIGRPGRPIVVSRTLHRSLLLGIVLAGLEPVWVRPRVDAATGLPTSVPPDEVARALRDHPDACGVFLGDPSYVGTYGDVAAHAAVAHAAGVPLLVDAAWAPHFGFHPGLPPHPLAAGADAMVISAHKALPAANQAAIVLARTMVTGGLLDADRLERGFEATHTTSPSGTILASIDASRALLARDGEALHGRLLATVAAARDRLRSVAGLDVLDAPFADGTVVDPAKLVVLLAGTGAYGRAVEADLVAAGMPVEMADRDVVVAMLSVADDAATVGRFVDELVASVERQRGEPRVAVPSAAWAVEAAPAMAPREAYFAPHEAVPASAAVGRVCAELVAPYPPGIPVLAPGEQVTRQTLDALHEARADGCRIAYAADPTLETLQVVR
jgi:arginine decarboxylase